MFTKKVESKEKANPYTDVNSLKNAITRKTVDPANVYIKYHHGKKDFSYQKWQNIVRDGGTYMLDQYVATTKCDRMKAVQRHAFDLLKALLADEELIKQLAPTPIKTGPQRLAEQMLADKEGRNDVNRKLLLDDDMDPDCFDETDSEETAAHRVVDDDKDPDLVEHSDEDERDDY